MSFESAFFSECRCSSASPTIIIRLINHTLTLSEILISLFILILILETTRLLLFDVHLLPRLLRPYTLWILPRRFFLIPLDPLLCALLTFVDELLLLLLTRVSSSLLPFGSLSQLLPPGRSILATLINSYVFIIRAFIISVAWRRVLLVITSNTVFLMAGTLLRNIFILIRHEHSMLYFSLVL